MMSIIIGILILVTSGIIGVADSSESESGLNFLTIVLVIVGVSLIVTGVVPSEEDYYEKFIRGKSNYTHKIIYEYVNDSIYVPVDTLIYKIK